MPIIIPKDIPAYKSLKDENVFVMTASRANTQDIRPIDVAILNLMPTKIETETQLMRLLSNTPLQVNITLINTTSYKSRNTSELHLNKFYKSFNDIKDQFFDALIVTGAPVETLEFEDVQYWEEIKNLFEWADNNVTSTIYICWAAQAALYYKYGIGKAPLEKKLFGIYPSSSTVPFEPLLKGLDDIFYIPSSRHTAIDSEKVYKNQELQVIASSELTGISIIKSCGGKRFYFTGHSEYDRDTLDREYKRDLDKGIPIEIPYNYYTDSSCTDIKVTWCGTANLIFYNWLNHYVYQITPYNIAAPKK